MSKFLKNWLGLIVATVAVVASVCALCLDYKHAEDALQSQQASDARHDEQFATAMSKAGEANELAGKANGLAGKANGLAGEANELAGKATGLAGKANDLAGEANDLAGEAHELAGEANDLAEEANDLAEDALRANEQYAEYTKLNNHLTALRMRITEQRIWLNDTPDIVQEYAEPSHTKAGKYWMIANKEIIAGNFHLVPELCDYVDASIEKCYEIANEVAPWPLPISPFSIEPGL